MNGSMFWHSRRVRFAKRRRAKDQAKDEVIDWLLFYNHRRRLATLEYLSPIAFAKKRLADQERLAASSLGEGGR